MKSFQQKITLILLLAFGSTFVSCAPVFEERFPDIYAEYVSLSPQKALAVAIGSNGGYAYGYGHGQETIKEAKEQAMFQCSTRRKVYQLDTECEIYMVNNERVEE